MMLQYQSDYDVIVEEYLDEALRRRAEEYEGMTTSQLQQAIITYLCTKYNKAWYHFSGRKVALALLKYRIKVTELLVP